MNSKPFTQAEEANANEKHGLRVAETIDTTNIDWRHKPGIHIPNNEHPLAAHIPDGEIDSGHLPANRCAPFPEMASESSRTRADQTLNSRKRVFNVARVNNFGVRARHISMPAYPHFYRDAIPRQMVVKLHADESQRVVDTVRRRAYS